MMQDDRTNPEAMAGLFDTDMLMSDEFSRSTPAAPAPAQPQAPMSVLEQMDERHGTLKNRLNLFSHLYSGGKKEDFGDDDLRLAQKQQALRGQLDGFDMENMSMSDVVALSQISPEMGKYAMEQYQFGRRVGDLGRAQGFMNDGVEDENDLWASETFGRYGKTADGQTTALDKTLDSWGGSRADFELLPAEEQRRILYQHGTDEDRKAADRVAGRQTLDQIEAEGAAERIGTASGDLTAEAIGFLPNAPMIAQDQAASMQGVDELITLFEDGDIQTGMFTDMLKKTFGIQTSADGKLGAEATKALIQQINSATFGALSEKEIETLEKGFANGRFTEEANLELLNDVKGKLQRGQDQHQRRTDESLRRIKDYAPDEYEFFMGSNDNWIKYGEGSKVGSIPQLDASGQQLKGEDGESLPDKTFGDFVKQYGDNHTREELMIEWDKRTTAAKDAQKAREEMLAEQQKQADEAMQRLTSDPAVTGQISPYIARPTR